MSLGEVKVDNINPYDYYGFILDNYDGYINIFMTQEDLDDLKKNNQKIVGYINTKLEYKDENRVEKIVIDNRENDIVIKSIDKIKNLLDEKNLFMRELESRYSAIERLKEIEAEISDEIGKCTNKFNINKDIETEEEIHNKNKELLIIKNKRYQKESEIESYEKNMLNTNFKQRIFGLEPEAVISKPEVVISIPREEDSLDKPKGRRINIVEPIVKGMSFNINESYKEPPLAPLPLNITNKMPEPIDNKDNKDIKENLSKIKSLSFNEYSELFNKRNIDSINRNSTALDILAIYLKGQKILYTEAKVYCEQQLNALMLPAIFISAACSVLSLALGEAQYGSYIVSGLTAFNSFLLSLISYLKLDAKAESHRTSAYQFDRLQALCEFTSGKVMFLDLESEKIKKFIEMIEEKVTEIKDTNQFLLPEKVRRGYPILCGMNVFTEVKKIQNKENVLINDLKKIEEEIQNVSEDNLEKLHKLENEKNRMLGNLFSFQDSYTVIDKDFEKEIEIQNKKKRDSRFKCFEWLQS